MSEPGGRPVLVLTQGDPAGIGPEILLRHLERDLPYRPVLVAECAALKAVRGLAPAAIWDRLRFVSSLPEEMSASEIPVLDPVGRARSVQPGKPVAADAEGAMAALDLATDLARAGAVDGMVTAPLSKELVARHGHPDFRGHTDYLAGRCGLERYGRDYLMTFLAPDLQVALLTTHLPLAEAVSTIDTTGLVEALECLHGGAGGRIAVAGLNPHAGEGGLLGEEDLTVVAPAVVEARRRGVDAHGPESPDSLFARARDGEFDWVLALYHDQGLIPVKTVAFGRTTNWTLGLPFVRTSVDHGTAYGIAGQGVARLGPLVAAGRAAVGLIEGALPRVGTRESEV